MIPRRTLVSCFAALLMAATSFAQSGPGAQSGPVAQSLIGERYVSPIGLPRPVPNAVPHMVPTPQGTVFTVTLLDSNWKPVSDTDPQAYYALVKNISADTQTIYFRRSQVIPLGWLSSVCWGTHCYPSTIDSMPFAIPPDSTADLILDLTADRYDEPDSASVWLRVGVVGSASDTVLLPFRGSFTPPEPPLIFAWSGKPIFEKTYQGASTWILANVLQHYSARGVRYRLSLEDSLPSGCSLDFCDLRPAYGGGTDTCVSGNTLVTNFASDTDYGSGLYQQKIKFTLTVPSLTQQDSAVIYLSVHPQTNNPADSANYRFVMTVMPPAGVVATTSDERAGIAVTNAWPNPLMNQSTLHLEILTDANGPAKAIVYDVAGTQKAVLDLGTLEAGTNQLQLAPPMLPSGEYLFRIVQDGSASEVVKINLLK